MLAIQDRLMALKNRNEQLSEVKVWKPQEGDCIAGAIVGHSSFVHQVYGVQDTILLETLEGVFSVILSKYLRSVLAAQGAVQGDLVAIKFCGQEKGKHGFFNRYNVILER
jgi:hypothetical protein